MGINEKIVDIKNELRNILYDGKIKECLYCGTTKDIIEAHTIQNNKYLRNLSNSGKIYTLDLIKNNDFKLHFFEIGRKEFSVFSGFCREHDNKLFEKIENDNIYCKSEEQNLLFAFRAFAYTYHKLKELKKIDYTYCEKNSDIGMSILNEIIYRNQKIYRLFPLYESNLKIFKESIKNEKYDSIFSKVITIAHECKMVFSSSFCPKEYTEREYKVENDFGIPLIYMSVFSERKRTYVIISCLKKHKKFFRRFFKKFDNKKNGNLEEVISNVILNNGDGLIGFSKEDFIGRFSEEKAREIIEKIEYKLDKKSNNFEFFNINLFRKKG